jgi:hypothetical protein
MPDDDCDMFSLGVSQFGGIGFRGDAGKIRE